MEGMDMTYWKETMIVILALVGGVDQEENVPYDPLEICYNEALTSVNPEVERLKCEAYLVKIER
jgi:hypothetical protein